MNGFDDFLYEGQFLRIEKWLRLIKGSFQLIWWIKQKWEILFCFKYGEMLNKMEYKFFFKVYS